MLAPGPYTVADIREDSYEELSNGYRVKCAPAKGPHSSANQAGATALSTDPLGTPTAIDLGHALGSQTLRAPDISVGDTPTGNQWGQGAPPLAVEYASTGTDNADLQTKIAEYLAHGSLFVWVVRLTGPRRVEVFQPNQPMQTYLPGMQLTAPGVLQNPVPVEALYDQNAALEVALRNLLNRRGYQDLDAVRDEGQEQVLVHQFERKLGRGLTDGQRITLHARLASLGASRLGDVVLDFDSAELQNWLDNPSAV